MTHPLKFKHRLHPHGHVIRHVVSCVQHRAVSAPRLVESSEPRNPIKGLGFPHTKARHNSSAHDWRDRQNNHIRENKGKKSQWVPTVHAVRPIEPGVPRLLVFQFSSLGILD